MGFLLSWAGLNNLDPSPSSSIMMMSFFLNAELVLDRPVELGHMALHAVMLIWPAASSGLEKEEKDRESEP